jgi:membrane protein
MTRWSPSSFFKNIKDVARATVFPSEKARSRKRFVLIYIVRLLFLVGRRLWLDNCPRQAAALAYQTMLSLVPLLAVAVSVTTLLELVEYQKQLATFAEAHLMPDAASSVGHYIIEAASSVHIKTLGIFGGATLLLISVMLLFNVERTINEIFRCSNLRSVWTRLLVAVVLLVLAPVAFGLSLYYTGKLVALPKLFGTLKPLLFSVATLFLCYWLIPRTRISFRNALISALVTGMMLEALKIGFAFYARYLGATLSYLYGTFAILPLSMIWIYLMWLVFLFGAELNAALHEVKRHDLFGLG